MANTWLAIATGIVFAAGKNMLAILNGGARVLRVRRIIVLNVQTASVTGVLCQFDIRRYVGAGISGHTAVTPIALDTDNSALDTVTAGYLGAITGTPATLRRVVWSSDEPAVSGATWDEFENLVPLNVVWDAGYGDAAIQALTIRNGQLVAVYNVTGAAGLADIAIEFTDEAS